MEGSAVNDLSAASFRKFQKNWESIIEKVIVVGHIGAWCCGHLEYRMQRIHRIQRIWRYRDVGVRGAPSPSARWRRLGPLHR